MEILRHPIDGYGFESANDVRDNLDEGIVGGQGVVFLKPHIDGGGSRAIEVYESFVDVSAIEVGPQSRARRENLSPSPAHMGQCDRVLVPVDLAPELWNENEDLERDAVDWGKFVIPGSDQVEDLKSVVLESLDLRGRTRK